jgi:hypothetical protein
MMDDNIRTCACTSQRKNATDTPGGTSDQNGFVQ